MVDQRPFESSFSNAKGRGAFAHLVVVLLLAFGSLSPSLLGQIPPGLLGTWAGTHTNGFGGFGPVSLVIGAVGNTVTLTVDVDGVVFGNPNPAPFVLGPAVFNGAQVVFNDPANPVYGNLTVTVLASGATTVTFNNVPANGPGVASGSSTGQIRAAGDPACGTLFPNPPSPIGPLTSPCLTGSGTLFLATGQ